MFKVKNIILLLILIFTATSSKLYCQNCTSCILESKYIDIKRLFEKENLKGQIFDIDYDYKWCEQSKENEIFIKSFGAFLIEGSTSEIDAIKKLFNFVISQFVFNNIIQEPLENTKVKLFIPCCLKVSKVLVTANISAQFDYIQDNACCCYIEYIVTRNSNNCNSANFGVTISIVDKKIDCTKTETDCISEDCISPDCTVYHISELLELF